MAKVNEKFYRQDINDLTDFVRNDKDWADLRNILLQKGFNLSDTLLVYFIEDEEQREYGVAVTKDKKVFEYSRSTAVGENNIDYFKMNEITGTREIDKYPQVNVAFKMIDEGQL